MINEISTVLLGISMFVSALKKNYQIAIILMILFLALLFMQM